MSPAVPSPTRAQDTPRRRRRFSRLALLGSIYALTLATCAPTLMTAGSVEDAEGTTLGVASERLSEPPDGNGAPLVSPPLPEDAEPLLTGSQRAPTGNQGDPPAADHPPELYFAEVTAERPAVRLSGEATTAGELVDAALGVGGVSAAAAVEVTSLALAVGEDEEVTVGVVDLEEFRVLTPQVTIDAVDVWRRLSEGDAAFTHDVGHKLKLEHDIDLGGRVPILDGQETLRIGAYASNGVPPVAQALVSQETGDRLGLEGDITLFVALEEGVRAEAALPALEQATGLAGEVIPEPRERRAFLTGSDAEDAFEPFTYVSLGDGMIDIDSAWVERNIVRADVPVFRGEVVCHRLMIPQLRGALQEIMDRGLDHLIDPSDYGGCWVPRHILFNPNRRLSMHAWGLAVDFNVSTNQYGAQPQMDPRIVEIFERWGFVWGGRWSTPDGMHFELGALLDDPD